MKKTLWMGVLLAAVVLLPAVRVEALVITPASGAVLTGNQTSQAQINAFIAGILGSSVELYKQNVGGSEEGSLAGSYQTEFFNSPTEPEDATITYNGGQYVGGTSFILVKDGNSTPAWYLFNLTNLGWNGTEQLVLENFWVGRGAISHVALYGTPTTSVPEPATLSLLAAGLLGAGVLRRRSQVA
jgi:hypothetical protein